MTNNDRVSTRISQLSHTDLAGKGTVVPSMAVLRCHGELWVVHQQVHRLRKLYRGRSNNHNHVSQTLRTEFRFKGFNKVVALFEGGVHLPIAGENFHRVVF